MHLLLAAKSGWGKSYVAQALYGRNLPDYERTILLDYKDEYRGLCSTDHGPGLARHWIAGPKERDRFGPDHWRELIEQNSDVVLARHPSLSSDQWRETIAEPVIRTARRMGDVLIGIDEAHFVAPQKGSVPDSIEGLATTGRGEGASSIWITQRLSRMEETVLAECDARFLGGFRSDADLSKIEGVTEYPTDVHKSGGHPISGLPESLHAPDDGAVSVRKHESGGTITGSEWIYSDDAGNMERRNSVDLDPACEHLGAEGNPIDTSFQ